VLHLPGRSLELLERLQIDNCETEPILATGAGSSPDPRIQPEAEQRGGDEHNQAVDCRPMAIGRKTAVIMFDSKVATSSQNSKRVLSVVEGSKIQHGMSYRLWGMLYRPVHLIANPRHA
jgi:hypothetical protein